MLFRRSLLTALSRFQPDIRSARSSVAERCLHTCQVAFAGDIHCKEFTVLTMPMLSPTMTEGALLQWLKHAGDQLEPYDLVFELETESLTEDAYKVGDFAGSGHR